MEGSSYRQVWKCPGCAEEFTLAPGRKPPFLCVACAKGGALPLAPVSAGLPARWKPSPWANPLILARFVAMVVRIGAAFYQLMTRMEQAGLIEGEYRQRLIGLQMVRERHYTIAAAGMVAIETARNFYSRAISREKVAA